MSDTVLFLTGSLAERALRRVLEEAALPHPHEVRNLGLSVAALMTCEMIARRLGPVEGIARIVVPGLCAGDVDALAGRIGVPVQRGPVDLKDLPAWLGGRLRTPDLSQHDMRIFAEVVDAPNLDIEGILARARRYADDGADVIDLGCLPGRPFPHLAEAVQALVAAGFRVSVDSLDTEELRRGAEAGAQHLLSLRESTLDLAFEVEAVPILIPETPGSLDSLDRAIARMEAAGRPYVADSILDPIHFGFAASIARYGELRRRHPQAHIMMGVGNVTELTDADTSGINAVLAGVMSELGIDHLLTTEVSPHARSAVREFDVARRMMWAARADGSLPRGYTSALMTTHARRPWPYRAAEVAEMAAAVRDRNYRIQVTEEGVHVYNRDGLWTGQDPYALFPSLGELADDPPHAFYMGAELARARIAWQLGKRYVQDEELDWGAAWRDPQAAAQAGFVHAHKAEGSTLAARRERRRSRRGDPRDGGGND